MSDQVIATIRVPEDIGPEPTLMNNLDRQIDPGFEEYVAGGGVCRYAGWDFNARVWKVEDRYYAQVWVYHQPRAVISAVEPEDLMTLVSEEFGYE